MSIISDVVSVGIGMAAGEELADSFTDDDNQLAHLAVGLTSAGIVSGLSKTVLQKTGIDDVLDDIFGF